VGKNGTRKMQRKNITYNMGKTRRKNLFKKLKKEKLIKS